MSGIVGHSLFALLGLKVAVQRRLPLAALAQRHLTSYLAGAYLGCDVQTMPEAICVDTGRECGYGTVPVAASPFTGGAVRPFQLATPHGPLSPRQVHEWFYGRAHLVFGWPRSEVGLQVPWDHLPDYVAAAIDDARDLFDPSERAAAYALGWLAHVVSDSLIKGIRPGVELHLIDGRYTPRNRPVQDLFCFHEIGLRELRLNWPALLHDLADTPVEPLQSHYMRCTEPRGRLAKLFPQGWLPRHQPTLSAVLAENRRWLRYHVRDVLEDLRLDDGECRESFRTLVGLTYAEMMQAAEAARYRRTLGVIATEIADQLQAAARHSTALAALPTAAEPDWDELMQRWQLDR